MTSRTTMTSDKNDKREKERDSLVVVGGWTSSMMETRTNLMGHSSSQQHDATTSPPWQLPCLPQNELQQHSATITTTSAWLDLDSTSPMVTHCRLPHAPSPLRRIRSRSLGDAPYLLGEVSSPTSLLLLPPLDSNIASDDSSSFQHKSYDSLLLSSPSQPHDEEGESKNAQVKHNNNKKKPTTNPIWVSVLYGLINTSIVLPVLMSFGSIIYCDPIFAPYLNTLIQLTIFSGMVHQVCFSSLSSLPFCVGQVQDAGLIFLSQMAKTMAHQVVNGPGAMLATVTVGLGLSTALLGLGLVVIGKLQLAQYVQALPTPVVGGYLAFIGWFCGKSGFQLMVVLPKEESTWHYVLQEQWMYWLPGLVGGLGIYVLVRTLRHMAVLPMCIVVILMVFYTTLWITDTSMEQATELGWIPKSAASTETTSSQQQPWYHIWEYVQLDKVVWSVLPSQILTLLSMIFVVAISSSLDVAAIELELNEPLDYNAELTMVGVSNLVSGMTAGYTGSYIFSQSIFSLRAGITSRLSGYVIASCELLVLLSPYNVLSVIPSFFFGSLLIMICVDLMYEWLWDVRSKLTNASYGICLGTFGSIQLLGVEYGIIAGIGLYLICNKILKLDMGDTTIATTNATTACPTRGEE